MSSKNLILSGGIGHDFAATSHAVASILDEADFNSIVREDVGPALVELGREPVDLLTVNLLRWRMLDRYEEERPRFGLELAQDQRDAILRHLDRGGGILALHAAPICFDDWAEWRRVLGAVWRWEQSNHPPLGPAAVAVLDTSHPLVEGLEDFDVVDEIYGFLDYEDDVDGLLTSEHGGTEHPLLWGRKVGGGRVVYDALGHDRRSFTSSPHRTIVRRAALWATGAPL